MEILGRKYARTQNSFKNGAMSALKKAPTKNFTEEMARMNRNENYLLQNGC